MTFYFVSLYKRNEFYIKRELKNPVINGNMGMISLFSFYEGKCSILWDKLKNKNGMKEVIFYLVFTMNTDWPIARCHR